MNLIEDYNQILHQHETETITMLNRVLDASFARLLRRLRIHLRLGKLDQARRTLMLLPEFEQLIPLYNPDRRDGIDRILQSLVRTAAGYGVTVAERLTDAAGLPPSAGGFATSSSPAQLSASLPLEAVAQAAAQARGYLTRHGTDFARTSAQLVAQGIAEGRPTEAMVQDLRQRLGVVKSRARTIVRTESLRAYNAASATYYRSRSVELVMYYATADDRTCPICTPSAGNIYKLGTITVPRHPSCRCYLAPWSDDTTVLAPSYAAMRSAHKREVANHARRPIDSADLSRAALFDIYPPEPVG
jgi:SPP1 gp7 family putative phage head morphogenesis protein